MLTIVLGKGKSILRVAQVSAGHYEFCASNLTSSSNNGIEIIGMSLLSMIFASENGVGKIDTNLLADIMCQQELRSDVYILWSSDIANDVEINIHRCT